MLSNTESKGITNLAIIVFLVIVLGLLWQATQAVEVSSERAAGLVQEEEEMFKASWDHCFENNPHPITITVSDSDFEAFKAKLDQAKNEFPPNC